MDQIQVLFDRQDRLYRFEEEVTGRVVLHAKSDLTYTQVLITHAWRSHGRGNRETGDHTPTQLAGGTFIRKGETVELSFHFKAPRGPVTYHGHYLNVDWYLAASAERDPRRILYCEQDFLLLPGEPAGPVVLGNKEVDLDDLPPRLPQEPERLQDLTELTVDSPARRLRHSEIIKDALGALFIVFFFVAVAWAAQAGPPGSAIGIIVILLSGFAAVQSFIWRPGSHGSPDKSKFMLREMYPKPDTVHRGSRVNCRLKFQARENVYLRDVEAFICAKERVTVLRATALVTLEHEISRKGFVKTFDEELSAGMTVSFECSLPVQADAPASFVSRNNALEWFVEVRVNSRGQSGLTERIPVIVLPG